MKTNIPYTNTTSHNGFFARLTYGLYAVFSGFFTLFTSLLGMNASYIKSVVPLDASKAADINVQESLVTKPDNSLDRKNMDDLEALVAAKYGINYPCKGDELKLVMQNFKLDLSSLGLNKNTPLYAYTDNAAAVKELPGATEWYDERFMKFLIGRLAYNNQNFESLFVDSHEGNYAVESMNKYGITGVLIDSDDSQDQAACKAVIHESIKAHKVMPIYVNINNTHWVSAMLVSDGTKNKIFYFDSVNSPAYKQELVKALHQCCKLSGLAKYELVDVDLKVQDNGYDCGPLSAQFNRFAYMLFKSNPDIINKDHGLVRTSLANRFADAIKSNGNVGQYAQKLRADDRKQLIDYNNEVEKQLAIILNDIKSSNGGNIMRLLGSSFV